MGVRVCGCTIGPPAGGVCNACGAVGAPLPHQHQYAPYITPPLRACEPIYILTEDRIREIVREEMARFAAEQKGGA